MEISVQAIVRHEEAPEYVVVFWKNIPKHQSSHGKIRKEYKRQNTFLMVRFLLSFPLEQF